MPQTWVPIAVVRSVNPARRELRVEPRPGYGHLLDAPGWVHVARGKTPLRCKVAEAAWHGEVAILRLAPGVPRDLAAGMKGAELVCAAETCAAPEAGLDDLESLTGMRVRLEDGSLLGTVSEVYAGRGNAAITVEKTGGGRVLLPVIEALIREVDGARGELRVGDIAPYAVHEEPESGTARPCG